MKCKWCACHAIVDLLLVTIVYLQNFQDYDAFLVLSPHFYTNTN